MIFANNCVFCLQGLMWFIWKESILSPTMSTIETWNNQVKTPGRPTQTPHEEIFWFHTHLHILCATPEDPGPCSALSNSSLVCLRGGLEPPGSILWGGHQETFPASGWWSLLWTMMRWWWYCNMPLSLRTVGFHVEDLRREYWTKQSMGPLLVLLCCPLSQRSWNIYCTTRTAPTTILNSQWRLDNVVNLLPVRLYL